MVYGGLRRSEIVRLNVGDYQPQFGLRRVLGKGGNESTVPLPEVARAIVSQYLATERPGAAASEPLFLVRYWWYGGERKTRRIFWSTDLEDHQGPRQARGCGHHPPARVSPCVRRGAS